MYTPRLLTAGWCTGTLTSSTGAEGAEPLGGSLAAVARQLWLYGISGISLGPVTAVPNAGGLQGLRRSELSRGGADGILAGSSAAGGGVNKTWCLGNACPSSTCRNEHFQPVSAKPSSIEKRSSKFPLDSRKAPTLVFILPLS